MNTKDEILEGHAYHYNLPEHYMDRRSGVPLVTLYANEKAKTFVKLAHSIQLSPKLYFDEYVEDAEMMDHETDVNNVDLEVITDEKDELVSIACLILSFIL